MLQENAKKLATKYTKTKRLFEIISVTMFAVFFSGAVFKIASLLAVRDLLVVALSQVAAMALADFVGGLVHWGCDTWGSLNSPLVGNTFIRSFREHHVDAYSITRHDWIETNGDNCLLTFPFMAYVVLNTGLPMIPDETSQAYKVAAVFLVALAFWVALTNQIHKWAHQNESDRPGFVTLLQRTGIILNRKHHNKHHTDPFDW